MLTFVLALRSGRKVWELITIQSYVLPLQESETGYLHPAPLVTELQMLLHLILIMLKWGLLKFPLVADGGLQRSCSCISVVGEDGIQMYRPALRRYQLRVSWLSSRLTLRLTLLLVICWMRANVKDGSLWSKLSKSLGQGLAPCESWSIARFHFDPALGPHQPRPIRTRSELWGCLCVRWKEHTQLDTGNRLLAFAVLVALGQAATGGFSFTEHPAEPSFLAKAPPEAPSIWYTQPLLWCMQSRLFTRILVQQGHYGAKSSKPTHLLLSGVDEPTALQIAAKCRTHQLPTRGSIGREGTEWATTALKEYPASLCQMLAQLFLHWHLKQTALPQRELATDLSWIRGLCIELDQRPRRPAPGPDYAGGYACPN